MGHVRKRERLMKRVKGFEAGRKNLLQLAKVADLKAGAHSYRDRRVKKRTMRAAWQVAISAGARENGLSYSRLMGALSKKGIALNRRVLSQMAAEHPELFKQIVAMATK